MHPGRVGDVVRADRYGGADVLGDHRLQDGGTARAKGAEPRRVCLLELALVGHLGLRLGASTRFYRALTTTGRLVTQPQASCLGDHPEDPYHRPRCTTS